MREETRLLRQFLRDKAIAGEMATYTDIDDAVGWSHGSCQGKRRNVLTGALVWLEREHGYVADCVTNKGYQFMVGDHAIVTSEQLRMKKVLAQTQKLADTVDACAKDATPETLMVVRSKINFMEWALDVRTQREIEQSAHQAKEELRMKEYRAHREELLKRLNAVEEATQT